ncbi:MAG TPA: hypothetical protein PLM62_18310, partial [Zoogloea sp.]|nr:hypothetical protein [Zoogloea sp.]
VMNGSGGANAHDVGAHGIEHAGQGGLAYTQLFNELPPRKRAAGKTQADGIGMGIHGLNGLLN